MGNSPGICVHETVIYAGIVYLKDEESTIKAFKMLTELDKEILFLVKHKYFNGFK